MRYLALRETMFGIDTCVDYLPLRTPFFENSRVDKPGKKEPVLVH